jgi:aminoglycoside phosphotransferase (APT) family kinase protein
MVSRIHDHLVRTMPSAVGIEMSPVEEATNGFSNRTEIVRATWSHDGVSRTGGYVLRSHFPGKDLFLDSDVLFQWKVMTALAEHTDIPLPPLVFADDTLPDEPYFVMGEVPGRVPPTNPNYHTAGWVVDLPPSDRHRVAVNGLAVLADIHRVDWRKGLSFLDRPRRGQPGLDQYLNYVEEWLEWMAKGRPFPVLDAALQYARQHQPASTDALLTWGDARIGNIMYADDLSVAAVLDWEMAALGPPEMDVGWWLMFDDQRSRGGDPLPGIPDRAETIEIYESMAKRTLGDVRYYEILAWLRIAITCTRMFAPGAQDEPTAARHMMEIIADYIGVAMD